MHSENTSVEPTELDLQSPTVVETVMAESTTGTPDDDDDRDDEKGGENEAPVREGNETVEAPEEFEIDDEDELDEDELDDDELDEAEEDELEDEEKKEEDEEEEEEEGGSARLI